MTAGKNKPSGKRSVRKLRLTKETIKDLDVKPGSGNVKGAARVTSTCFCCAQTFSCIPPIR